MFNDLGVQASSLLGRAANLSMIDYLLIHGTGDGECMFAVSNARVQHHVICHET